ncbi:LysE family translocator [Pseudogemmobacter sonorensis]|uniref:LysE family translocator n=1 Tax=Pseudogemmobacter sonorensis TaxID=2989681 RepID=UPI0036C08FE8
MDPTLFTTILAPLGIYALAVPMPGPGFIVISRASIAQGPAHGAAAAFGTTASVSVYALATALGISALLVALPWLSSAIQIAGGAYLVWMGIALLRTSLAPSNLPGRVSGASAESRESLRKTFRRGLLVGLGNPKMAAFFLGLLAPAMAGDLSLTARLLVLGCVILIDLIYHQSLAWIAAKGRGMAGHTGKWFDVIVGGSMVAFGGFMIARSFGKS